jgi:hypothetical protein
MSIYLYAHRIPKRVFPIFNHLGIATSFDTVHRGLRSLANDCRDTLRSLYLNGKGIQVSFDNMQTQRNVRYERQHNRAGLITGTAGFIAVDSQDKQFTREDVDYKAANTLTIADFLPTKDDDNVMEVYIQFQIFETLKSWGSANDVDITKAQGQEFYRPVISSLDPKSSASVHPLPVYALDESRIADTINIYDRIAVDLGLNVEHITKSVIPCKGDYMTVANSRWPL